MSITGEIQNNVTFLIGCGMLEPIENRCRFSSFDLIEKITKP